MCLNEFRHKRKKGVSGFMRVKNDAEFVEASIDSCIDALDELIIVYNGCLDNTPELVEKKRQEYPNKIKVFEYKHKVYSVNLSKEEYEYALALPDDSPCLLCNYYNFALSKVEYEYAMKIDADQIYFSRQLKEWCDLFRSGDKVRSRYRSTCYYIGWLFNIYFLVYKFVCFRANRFYHLLPAKMVGIMRFYYRKYLKYKVTDGNICLSLSGLNVFRNGEWGVCMGKKDEIINVLPPFNGEGDHLIFKVSSETYFRKYSMPYYNILSNSSYSLIEEFVHPYKVLCAGFAWFHLNAMRLKNREKVKTVMERNPRAFVKLSDFFNLKYEEIVDKADQTMFSVRQKVLFSFIYKSDVQSLKDNVRFLQNINL